jgi:5-methylcytosine-specific restriction endonuclease McrA
MTFVVGHKSGMTGKSHSEETRHKMAESRGKENYLARQAGQRFYFTGIPCKNGHISERYSSRGACVQCAKEKAKAWQKSNKPKMSEKAMKRHTGKLKRTPSWLNSGHHFEIECVYKYCGVLRSIGLNYQVDHIVPLQGKNVSGFHVPWNLQVISAKENASKGNHYVQ